MLLLNLCAMRHQGPRPFPCARQLPPEIVGKPEQLSRQLICRHLLNTCNLRHAVIPHLSTRSEVDTSGHSYCQMQRCLSRPFLRNVFTLAQNTSYSIRFQKRIFRPLGAGAFATTIGRAFSAALMGVFLVPFGVSLIYAPFFCIVVRAYFPHT